MHLLRNIPPVMNGRRVTPETVVRLLRFWHRRGYDWSSWTTRRPRRLFCHITANWRGTPLTTYETIVDRIGNTRTEAGLQVQAELDTGQYPTGVTVTSGDGRHRAGSR